MTLRVRVSIVPFGDENLEHEIEVINISNRSFAEGTQLRGTCPYVIERNQYKEFDDDTPRVYHARMDGALTLVRKALEELGY